MKTLLVIDNYDSFTHNLIQMFMRFALRIRVFRNDEISVDQAAILYPDYLLISPGPRDPFHAGISMPLIREFTGKIPVLGVCLGMQCLNESLGGRTIAAPNPVHGKTDTVFHDGRHLFSGIASPFQAARYHSLMVDAVSRHLAVTAWTADNVIMGLAHQDFPVFGLQFHPESFMTENGDALIENFLFSAPAKGPVFSEKGAKCRAASGNG
ncbi:MAG: aminodeoxychorismate/anthranilate synthase component II [Desulfosalsimonadaceae bacterium]